MLYQLSYSRRSARVSLAVGCCQVLDGLGCCGSLAWGGCGAIIDGGLGRHSHWVIHALRLDR